MTATARTPYWPDSTIDGDWLASPDDDGVRRPSFPARYLSPIDEDMIGRECGEHVEWSPVNGATPNHSLPEWREQAGHFESRPTKSSTGRRSFVVTRRHAVHVEHIVRDRVGYESFRMSGVSLAQQADLIMRDHASTCDGCDDCGYHDDQCGDECVPTCEHRPIALIGTDQGIQWEQVVYTADRSDETREASDSKVSWPTRYRITGGKRRTRASERPDAVTLTDGALIGYARQTRLARTWDVLPATLTVTALPSWTDQADRIHVGCQTRTRSLTRAEQQASKVPASPQNPVNVPQSVANPIELAWSQLTPGTTVETNVRGNVLTLSMGQSGQVNVRHNGQSWKSRTARAVAARIA
jgi:hypothetical protein